MITGRGELTAHDLHLEPAPPTLLRRHRDRARRELYTGEPLRRWFKNALPGLTPTVYSTGLTPFVEACTILGRFAAGARLIVEPDEDTPGDIKLLSPPINSLWELKTGEVRIFGWFHDHDCFVAYSGAGATGLKAAAHYQQHIDAILLFLASTGLTARPGDHFNVITL